MIEEIKKRLESGERVELECIDVDGYRSKNPDEKWSVLNLDKIIVTSSQLAAVSVKGANVALMNYELKYFRIKRPAPTFDDLIDVAVKAYKDGTADKLAIGYDGGIERVMLHVNGYAYSYYQSSDMSGHIEHINSLYTETFVIESEEDINKVLSRKEIGFNRKSMSVATLMNGNEILITRLDPDNTAGIVVYMRDGLYKNYLGIDVLKGATVTQKRGK